MGKGHSFSGFSLIELAISLLIMGIIAAFTIPLLTVTAAQEQTKRTQNHQEQIVHALASYVAQHHRLPCPSETDEGLARKKCQASACVGTLPFRTLNLPEAVAKDGYGHWITYAVHPDLTRTVSPDSFTGAHFCEVGTLNGAPELLSVRDLQTHKPVNGGTRDPIAFVLISHGPEGSGAFLSANGEHLPAQNVHERENSLGQSKFVTGHGEGFRHSLFWVSRNNFMGFYVKSPCLPRQSLSGTNNEAHPHFPPIHQEVP